ncbi:peptidoglycan DD-metalloendopeptidase family protein [Shinella sp.]|uniref:peptidoglycan DD-metalloendopeptidase family protein n=1 Tax=Shinella sp. TaxID=1870904 RepID=UPI003F7194FD
MRKSVSPSFGRTATRLVAAALLASVATGCSSDVSRFGGLFSSSGSDNITTSSVPRRTLFGNNVVPRGSVGNGQQVVATDQMGTREQALNQEFPDQGTVSYDPINTSTTGGSGTRLATTPMTVQRGELNDPTAGARQEAERDVAMAQELPERKVKEVDTLTTSTVKGKAGWSTKNAPVVMLRQGESVKTLANRYGVPEKEILAANGLKRAADAEPGQKIVIPTFSTTASAAKASTDHTLKVGEKLPTPERKGEQNVAILPGTSTRDKVKSETGQTNSKVAEAGEGKGKSGYEVQPGDSLAKIARSNGVSVDALKKANGLETASIRIGQKLTIPAGGASIETTTDKTTTASVPVNKEKKVETTEKKPETYKAPVKTVSVTEATEKSDVTEDAPESTGIGKYRWPVRGAVIAGYGANVEGNRNDGIDISVPEGTPIKAAENGVVIYAGSSLKELGNAVLVRHDDGTVTVYGHAGDLSVQRGQKIQRGQTVATSGMSGNATRPKVHFEVRKNATPVNPMTFLE